MIRMLMVLMAFALGITFGLGNAVFASCFFIWNDVFRPAEFGRYYGALSESVFYPVHICTAVLLLSVVLKPWKRRWNFAATATVVALGWFFVCVIFAQFRDIAYARTIMAAKYMIPLAFISATLCTRRAQQWFLYTLAGSVGVWLAHHGLMTLVSGEALITMAIPGGQMSDRNDFLVAGSACLPLLVYASFRYEGPFQKWLRLGGKASIVFALAAFVFSLSRGAMVGLAGLAVWYGFLSGNLLKRLPIVIAAGIVMVIVMPAMVWERLDTIEVGGEMTDSSAINRLEHMVTAVDVTLDYPITGVGASNFPPVSTRYSVFSAEPHSLWLKCSAEYGLPMLVFFMTLVGYCFWRLRQRGKLARAVGDKDGMAMSTALSCALFGFLATGTFTSQFLSEYMWAIIGLIGAFLATPLQGEPDSLEDPEQEPAVAAAAA